jgi:ADP-heptose:LPS heptosyltransferase
MESIDLDPARPIVAFAPYSKQDVSAWPQAHVRRFAELAANRFNLVVFGAPEEAVRWERDTASIKAPTHMAFGMNIRETKVALDYADIFVALNTGSSHLFQTLRIPMLRLDHHGMPFQLWSYEDDSRYHFLRNPVPCGPCFLGSCRVPGHPCMSGITPENAIGKVESILKEVGKWHAG